MTIRKRKISSKLGIGGFPGGSVVKNVPASAGDTRDMCLIPGSERSPREGNGNPLQYSCLGNPMDRGAWQLTVHGITKSQTRWAIEHACTEAGNRKEPLHTVKNIYKSLRRHTYGEKSNRERGSALTYDNTLNSEKSNRERGSALTTPLQHNWSSNHYNKVRERNGLQIENEEIELLLFADDLVVCIKKSQDIHTQKKIRRNEFSKILTYKINTQK